MATYIVRHGKLLRVRPKSPQRFQAPPLRRGLYLGACNRSHCLEPGADWYNRGSCAFYCRSCAEDLNWHNRHDEFCKDQPLCYKVESEEEASKLHARGFK